MSFTNPAASFSSSAYTPDMLLLDDINLLSRKITLLSGQNLVRGSVLGQITLGAASSAVKASGANTGTGTLVLDVTTPILPNAIAGLYTVRCTVASANAATFRVTDPKGVVLGDVSFSGSLASGTFADRIKFAVTDAATDFIVGDGFDITIAAGSGKYVLSLAAAVDGSAIPDCILIVDTNASASDVDTEGYFRGRFADSLVTLGTGQTVAAIREGLRQKGIDLVPILAA
jgi:Bacteriophage lambda head decoration protein D